MPFTSAILGLALFAATPAGAPAGVARVIEVRGAVVTLGDLADLSELPPALRTRAAALPIARVRPHEELVLGERQAAIRAGALMPALKPLLAPADGRLVVRRAGAPSDVDQRACLRLARPLVSGAPLTQGDVAPAGCGAERAPAAFAYDAALRCARAVRDLAEGDVVQAVPAFALAAVRPGQTLYLKSRAGPVVVERQVEALQPARPGGRLFVRGADGEVFSAELGEVAP